MNKEQRIFISEYASTLTEEEVRFLVLRLTEKLPGDLGECCEMLSKDSKVDEFLMSAESNEDFFNKLDSIRDVLQKESKKKNSNNKN